MLSCRSVCMSVCTENDVGTECMCVYICMYKRELEITVMRVFRHPQVSSVYNFKINFIELMNCKYVYAKGLCLHSFTIALCANLLSFQDSAQISCRYATPGSKCHTVAIDCYGGLMKPLPCCGQCCQG